MPLRHHPIPQDEGSARFEQPFPQMLAVRYRGMLVGAAELKTNEYIYYMSPDVDVNARVEFETQLATTGIRLDGAFDDNTIQRLVALNVA